MAVSISQTSIVNFRDLGGIPVGNGKRVKSRRILRSGELAGLHPADRELLIREFNLKTIVDFRSDEEIAKSPNDVFEGVRTLKIDLLRDQRKREDELTSSKDDLAKIAAFGGMTGMMKAVYRSLVSDPSALEGYRQYVDEYLALEEGSLIFHCYAGKDRTGVAAAIILSLLGADERDIFTDYLLTNELRAEINSRLLAQLRAEGATEQYLENYTIAMCVDEAYLRHAYEIAREESGSFPEHIIRKLHITPGEIARLQALYTE
ncbi:tyrosine-protein phosphatase [Ruminococcaceae bacterium OttesenSCG-928-L11]|nr:tyrosine-protein phosphatase [Ruminococcaceae bacterium OttesenSCG-928-L11]